MKARIDKAIERMFVKEPALFAAICTHRIVENDRIRCPVRTGRGAIEYNPDFVREMTDAALVEALKTEAIRILLKHPYERRPDGCCGAAIAIGSNLTIADNYPFARFHMETPSDYGLKEGLEYEVYSRLVQARIEDDPLNDGDAYTDLSGLWDEDPLLVAAIDSLIEAIRDWGSLAGSAAEFIVASAKARLDWRKVLGGFRASIISTQRKLTRMRPNRRTGFENMGSIRRYDTKLLVAVDVSGSVSGEAISCFLGAVNRLFKYGFPLIDVIQFDTEVTCHRTLTRAMKDAYAVGRGGTNFQAPIDFATAGDYDGLVILTDGYAPEPVIPKGLRPKILWVCEDEECLAAHVSWMRKHGRACTMKLG